MAQYFDMDELTRSDTAQQRGIKNVPSEEQKRALQRLMDDCLDPIRRLWGKPIIVNSGFRCPELNRAVGGSATSQHMKGEAADITTGSIEGNKELFEHIAYSGIQFDQLIDEKGYKWIHVSYKTTGNRKNVLHL